MHQPYHLSLLYSEHCPEEPTIPKLERFSYGQAEDDQEDLEEQISRATRVISQKRQSQTFYTPKIIKSKRPLVHKSYEMREHQRELSSMKKRIEECKNKEQRKKDRNDPMVYPPYFIRANNGAKDVRIDGYSRKVADSKVNPHLNKFQPQRVPVEVNDRNSLVKYQYVVNVQAVEREEQPGKVDEES